MSGSSNGSWAHNEILPKLTPAFAALLNAFDCAADTASDCWEFAISIRRFRKIGLSETDLRWLVRKGYVEHAREITKLDDSNREFRRTGNSSFCKRTCFVLTNTGIEFARSFGHNGAAKTNLPDQKNRIEFRDKKSSKPTKAIPVWDTERRELRLNGDVIKHFKWSAMNQETILSAFEEEHWPARIDDPLPPHAEQDSKRRLSDTIKCLNRKQQHPLIHFRGDGTGEGVIWEYVKPSE